MNHLVPFEKEEKRKNGMEKF